MMLFAALSISVAANAIVFRSTQNLCCGSDQMILYSDGTYKLYQRGVEAYSGTYTIDSEYSVVVLNVEGTTLRCKYHTKDGRNISYLTFQSDTFRPCNR